MQSYHFSFFLSGFAFSCFAFSGLTIFFPVFASISFLVLPAIVPPCFAMILLSSKVLGFFSLLISAVVKFAMKKNPMRVLLEIKDNKAQFIMELLKNFSFVKAKPLSPYKAEVLSDLKEAIDNLNLVNKGKLKAQSARDLYNEL